MSILDSIDYRHGGSVNRFRRKRGALLRGQIARLAERLGRPLVVLDVGGRADYWDNVGLEHIAQVMLINARQQELDRPLPPGLPEGVFSKSLGDARDLDGYADQSVDLVHANSVIEHVGSWEDMARMASEARRVGRSGWVQTPAWSFPIEPHFHAPFMHWFGTPLRARMMSLSLRRSFRRMDLATRRRTVEGINLLTRSETAALFPGAEIHVERVLLLAKSYVVHWMPAEAAASAGDSDDVQRAA